MAKIEQHPTITLEATLRLTEVEVRALDAMVGYGFDGFIKVFYEHMGRSYMQPHEAGLKTFFESVRKLVPSILHRTDDARRVFTGERIAAHPPKAQSDAT